MKKFLFILLLFGLISPSIADQFGLEMGESIKSVRRKGVFLQKMELPEQYYAKRLPEGNPDFEGYILEITPKAGLCKIVGIKKPFPSNSSGVQIISMFNLFEKELSKKYGDSKIYNAILPDSKYLAPKDFIKSLNVQDRVLSASWVKENNQLGKDMDNIMLRAVAPDVKTASLFFIYSFNNWNECQQELGIGSFKGL